MAFDAKRYQYRYDNPRDEFLRIEQAIRVLADGIIEIAYAAPDKPRDGMVRLADGTRWNPGSGQGVYVYYNNTWNKL